MGFVEVVRVAGRKKKRVTISIDPDLKDRLDAKSELNVSKLGESLYREYLAHGESTTVALHLLRDDLRRKRDNKQIEKRMVENDIQALDDQIAEVTDKIRERREAGLEGIDDIVGMVERGEMNGDYLHEHNPMIRDRASASGVPPARYVEEVEARL